MRSTSLGICLLLVTVLPVRAETDPAPCVFGRLDRFADLLPREPRFAKAAAFLSRTDLATLPVGRYEIDGKDVFASVQECKLKDRASDPKPEAHRAYIDIQVPLSGEETFGYGWLTEKNYTKPFDRKKDFGLYREQPLQWRTLKPGEFAVFFPPYGVHAPCCREGGEERAVRKLVIKVRKTGETLYNGIELPGVWPPKIDLANRGAMEVPYLEEANIPKVIPIDLGRQLFVDDFLIERTDLARIYPKPVKYAGNPVLWPETAREKSEGGLYPVALPKGGGLWWDPERKVFRLWYEASWIGHICYAESKDGIRFERVNTDVEPGGNCVLPQQHVDSWSVVPDPECADPAQRWKLFVHPGCNANRTLLYVSADGIHWTGPKLSGAADDRSTMFYNPFRRKWCFSLRSCWRGRSKNYAEFDDFLSSDWQWPWNGVSKRVYTNTEHCVLWMAADRLDRQTSDPDLNEQASLYSMDAVAYESIMLGAAEIHWGPENDVCGEKGEYHTIMVDGPIFKKKIEFRYDRVYHNGKYCSLICNVL